MLSLVERALICKLTNIVVAGHIMQVCTWRRKYKLWLHIAMVVVVVDIFQTQSLLKTEQEWEAGFIAAHVLYGVLDCTITLINTTAS